MSGPDGSDAPGSDPDDRDGSSGSDDREELTGSEEGEKFDGLAAGWQVWNEDESKVVLVYRPDVFNAREFPAACLPTIYVTQGRRSRRPGTDPLSRPGDSWYVTFFLEPEVGRDAEVCDDRAAAITAMRDLTERFASGDLDYRALYQVPREAYLDRLDELTDQEG